MIVHELGHFITALRSGVRVLEFGFGFPPKIFGITRHGIEYSLNWLPIGGFVKMVGEEDPTDPNSLAAKPIPIRLLVLSAGVIMNLLLAVVLFAVAFMVPKETVIGQVQVVGVQTGTPAAAAGLQQGDLIVKVNGREIQNTGDLGYNVQLNLGQDTEFTVLRNGEPRIVTIEPRWNPPQGEGALGIQIGMTDMQVTTVSHPIWQAIPLGLQKSADMLTITKNDLLGIIVKRNAPPVAGPIGIYQMTGAVARSGFSYLLDFTALLSINLAIINILPVPMLDGGRIVFVLIEWIRGKRVPPEKEGLVHLAGLVLILTLLVVVSYYDIVRLITNEPVVR